MTTTGGTGIGSTGSDIPISQGIDSTGTTQTGQSNTLYKSTLTQSEIEAIAEMLMAGFPILQPPNNNFTNIQDFSNAVKGAGSVYTEVMQNIQDTQNKIINYMWDKFKETLDEIDERRKEDQKKEVSTDSDKQKPMSPSAYLIYLISVAPHERAVELDPSHTGSTNAIAHSGTSLKFNETFNQWLINPVGQADNPLAAQNANVPSSSFITGTTASSPDVIRAAVGNVDPSGNAPHMSTSPIADAIYFIGPASGLPTDYQAAAALIAALLNSGVKGLSEAEAFKDAAQKGQTQNLTPDFALNYAKNILALITHSMEEGQSMSEDKSGQANLIRLLLATMAVTLMYRAVFGRSSPEEFEGLVNGDQIQENEFVSKDAVALFGKLIAQLNSFLPSKETDPEGREHMLAQLKEYVASQDPLDSMLATTKLFKGMLETDSYDSNRLASNNG